MNDFDDDKYLQQKHSYYQALLGTKAGRFIIMDLVHIHCDTFNQTHNPNHNAVMLKEGRRNIGLEIYNYCKRYFATELRLAEDEYNNFKKQNNYQ
ncbi:hypothetical protein AAEX28_04685 [Lentisphaerota bacterium WC36G]|nr:hypothetical protein LJT99_07545 [Lentisphaerae bacterium WC36]